MVGLVIFKLPLSKVRGRLDPAANRNWQPLISMIHHHVAFSEIVTINPRTSFDGINDNSQITFISMDSVNQIDGQVTDYQTRKYGESKGYTKFQEGDILWAKITPCMENGKSTIAANLRLGFGFGSTEFHVFRVNSKIASIQYVHALLRLQRLRDAAVNFFGGSAGHQRVDVSFFERLQIPLPPLAEQQKAEVFMQTAYVEKKQLEKEASALLAQVDEVLLKHLGITLPKPNSDALGERIFVRKLSSMEQRLDALFYQTPLLDFLRSSHCTIQVLSSVVRTFQSGFAAGKGNQAFDEGVIQIRPTNINEDREFVFDRNVYLPAPLLQEFPHDRLQNGEVLFNNTNSQELVGKTVSFDLDGDFFCSNHITRIGVDTTKLNPRYLCAVLNAYQRMKIFYAMCVNWNNQSGINIEALRKLRIPVPSLTIQDNIVVELGQLQSQATALRQQALKRLDAAKAQVEHLIFGAT